MTDTKPIKKAQADPSAEYRAALKYLVLNAKSSCKTDDDFAEVLDTLFKAPKKRVISAKKMLEGKVTLQTVLL